MPHYMLIAKKLVITFFLLLFSLPAFADATIKVQLWDNGTEMDLSKNLGMGLGSMADMSKAMMGIKVDHARVARGKVSFDVTNTSTATVHEMLVAPIKTRETKMSFIEAENRVDEEKAGHLGEVSELEPGKSGSLTLNLKPGLYALYCNVPGHFMAGMWAIVEVK